MIATLFLLTLLFPQQPTPKHQLLRIVQCKRVLSDKPYHTGIDCGVLGETPESRLLMDIPDTLYEFPKGRTFNFYIYNDGEDFPEDKQPKGSVVIRKQPESGR